jgi:murein DD-endopeptidase MepM/ murein hydrolase activator NlpD
VKKTVSLLLTLVLSVGSFTSVRADDLTDAQNKLNDVKDSISDKKDELNNINKQQQTTQNSLNELDTQMNAAGAVLKDLNIKLIDLNNQISQYEKQIKQTQENLDAENELFKKRMRALYINGNEGYIDLLINSKSFSEFISRIDFIRKLMEYDKNLITSIDTNKKALQVQKSGLEKSKDETTVLKQQSDGKLKELQAASSKKKELMASLEKNKSSVEKMLAQEESESKTIGAMIAKIQQQRVEERKKTSENGSTVPTTNSSIGKLYNVTGKTYPITSQYGWRVHPVLGTKKFHAGIDIGVWSGTPIYSLADGVVIYSGWMSGYGNVVMINHGSLTSVYGHNSSLVVKEGQAVKGGQLISYSGNTGISSGPHMHFELRKENGNTIDPNPYYVK